MMREKYIKVSDFCKEIDKGDLLVGNNADWAKEIAHRTPPSDVSEVKHAKWINGRYNDWQSNVYEEQCSYCGRYSKDYGRMFCSNCGAVMDLK